MLPRALAMPTRQETIQRVRKIRKRREEAIAFEEMAFEEATAPWGPSSPRQHPGWFQGLPPALESAY